MEEINPEYPLVSIIVPMFNLEKYIGSTLKSLLGQSYSNLEIIAIDDLSTDRTAEIAADFAKKDSRIKLFNNHNRSGASGARNTGIEQAKGEWIAFLDGDDILDCESINFRVESAKRNPKTPFLSGDFFRFRNNPEDAYDLESEYDPAWRSCLSTGRNEFGEVYLPNPCKTFLARHLTWTGSAFIRKDLIKQIGGFDESLQRSEDIQFWLRAAAHSESFVFVSKSISYYRQRPGSLSKTRLAPDQHAPRAFKSLRLDPAFKDHLKDLDHCIRDHTHKNTYYYRKNKMQLQALKSAAEGLAVDPLGGFAWKNLIGSILRL